jgi:hypothetical protein
MAGRGWNSGKSQGIVGILPKAFSSLSRTVMPLCASSTTSGHGGVAGFDAALPLSIFWIVDILF